MLIEKDSEAVLGRTQLENVQKLACHGLGGWGLEGAVGAMVSYPRHDWFLETAILVPHGFCDYVDSFYC